jgi:energy-coupling factor transporter ATP-binding protein EcfA2
MSLVLYGPPGCGKSSVATSLGKIMQTIAGREPDEDKIKNRGGDPKFEPAITTSTEVIISDDFGNDTSHPIAAKEVLDIVNVTREVIPKAGVHEKNKFRYSNIGAIFTTNDINVGINQIQTVSYESILRRYGLVIKMSPLPEYCIEGTQVLNRNHPHLLDGTEKDDIYTIDILRPITVNKSKSGVSIRYEQVNGWKRDGLSEFKSFIHFIRGHLAQEWAQNVK